MGGGEGWGELWKSREGCPGEGMFHAQDTNYGLISIKFLKLSIQQDWERSMGY